MWEIKCMLTRHTYCILILSYYTVTIVSLTGPVLLLATAAEELKLYSMIASATVALLTHLSFSYLTCWPCWGTTQPSRVVFLWGDRRLELCTTALKFFQLYFYNTQIKWTNQIQFRGSDQRPPGTQTRYENTLPTGAYQICPSLCERMCFSSQGGKIFMVRQYQQTH